ncbi:DNA-dependent RNA polymerase subunit epsilon [Virgibacillus halophilus]|uniref:DNA-dependent RNA polymerase subunit epsilon n=1 Tax=Tigheibacillus halophilus TaxID=361280 RepID=UPI003631DBA5
MIFKVLYQESPTEVPVRERTKSLYVEADSDRDARKKLAARKLNIEYIHPLDEAQLAYEKRSEDFKVEEL